MGINYNKLAKTYDITRKENISTITRLVRNLTITPATNILDFGCGTGNFTCAIKEATNANVFGLDPSDGMREQAMAKDCGVQFVKGDHTSIPFADDFFDMVYMTDVVHHVPDLDSMFQEFQRVLKAGGLCCIVTESHQQLETRYWARYFPATVDVDKKRYPDIGEIIAKAVPKGFAFLKMEVTDHEQEQRITPEFLKLVENKGYSMFRLIREEDYQRGLAALKVDYAKRVVLKHNHGETFLWLAKQ